MVTTFRIVGMNGVPFSIVNSYSMRPVEYKAAQPGAIKSSDSLMELMDGLIMFYHIAAHKQLQNVRHLNVFYLVVIFKECECTVQCVLNFLLSLHIEKILWWGRKIMSRFSGICLFCIEYSRKHTSEALCSEYWYNNLKLL